MILLNRYGHKPIVSKFLVIVFRVFRCALGLNSLFHFRKTSDNKKVDLIERVAV